MKVSKDVATLSKTVSLDEYEIQKIADQYPGHVAHLFAKRYVEENYDKLVKDGILLTKAKVEAQHIIAAHIAKRVTEAVDKGLGIKI